MRRVRLLLIAIALLPALGGAREVGEMCGPLAAAPSSAPATITVTVNPEARVRAVLSGVVPRAKPGKRSELLVKIVNQGFVTARLEVELVGEIPGATIDFEGGPLRGVGEEFQRVYFTLPKPGHADLTLAFRLRNIDPEDDAHNRVHFLVQCAGSP